VINKLTIMRNCVQYVYLIKMKSCFLDVATLFVIPVSLTGTKRKMKNRHVLYVSKKWI